MQIGQTRFAERCGGPDSRCFRPFSGLLVRRCRSKLGRRGVLLGLGLAVAGLLPVRDVRAGRDDPGRAFPQRHPRPGPGGPELRAPEQELVRPAPRSRREDRLVRLQRRPERDGGDLRQRHRPDLCRARARRSTPTSRSRGDEVRVIAGAVNGGSALVVQPDGRPARRRPISAASGSRRRSSATRRTSPPAPGCWPAACKITQTGGDAQVRADAESGSALAVPEQAARCGVDRRALGVAARARGRRQDPGRREGRGHDHPGRRARSSCASSRELATRFVGGASRADRVDHRRTPKRRSACCARSCGALVRAELCRPSWSRAPGRGCTLTTDASLAAFQTWVTDAQQVGFLRNRAGPGAV